MELQLAQYKNCYVLQIPRCASSSIRDTVDQTIMMHPEDIGDTLVYAPIRDPVLRFWSFINILPEYNIGRTDYKDMLGDILDEGKKDPHWIPQARFIEGIKNIKLFPFEQISYVWNTVLLPEHGAARLPHTNKSQPTLTKRMSIDSRYRIDELYDYYKEDFDLREKINDPR